MRLALRTLFRSPFVTTVAILSLALGIGANAAIFSMFDQVLLQPLPVVAPEQLVNLSAPGPKPGSQSCNDAGSCELVVSYPMFRDLEKAESGFSGVAAHRLFGANIAFEGETLSGRGMLVSGSYFPVLGVRPARGRLIGTTDDVTIGAHSVAVLDHAFWETRLGARPDVIGKTITVNGRPLEIIGIAPDGFGGTTLGSVPHVFVPLTMRGYMAPGWEGFEDRRNYWAYVFARLKPGVSLAEAGSAINAVYRRIINDVEAPLQEGMSEQGMARFRARQLTLEEGRRGQSNVQAEARTPLLLLFATTGIVLLIACANIANLLLARGASRGMEMAVRLSLGAKRRQVLAQLLTESLLLAVLGGIASLLVARWTLTGIAALLPADVTESLPFTLRPSVIAFAALLSIATGFLFGMFPALHSTRPDLVGTIRANAGNITVTRGAARFRSALVTAQIALSMALLISAGLFLKSLVKISRVDLGIRTDNVITFALSPELNGYEPTRAHILFEQLEQSLAALPGVTGVTAALVPILGGSSWGNDVRVEGFQSGPDIDSNARFNEVGPGYFTTLGIPVLAGREFTVADNAGAEDVAVVNEAFVRKFNLGRDVVGKRMALDDEGELDIRIVGVVKDAKYNEVKGEIPPLFFLPWRQDEDIGAMAFYVRSSLPPAAILRSVPSVVAALDRNLPVEDLKTLPQQVRENVSLDRMISTLSGAFATLATLLAAIGLYGVLAYTVARRTREIGVRIALGADRGRVRGMVLRQVVWMLAIGGAVGIAGAIVLGRAASSLLFGVNGVDFVVMIVAAVVLGVIALGAGFIPAHRAARVDPIQALRYE